MSRDGVVLAWVSGQVGTQFPSTSPASENVAALATTHFPRIDDIRSDYKGLAGLEDQTPAQIYNRKGLYSGVRRILRGVAPGRRVTHVRGHANPDEAETPEELSTPSKKQRRRPPGEDRGGQAS